MFDGVSVTRGAELSGDYKIDTSPYLLKHGAYYSGSFEKQSLLMGEQDLSLDLELPFIHLTRIQALNYNAYIQYNLSKEGRLWAVDTGGKLIWAFAVPKHPPYSDYEIREGRYLRINMDFVLPEGVWHIANTDNVFLEPYDMCDFKNILESPCDHDCNALQQCSNVECTVCKGITANMSWCNTCYSPYDTCHNPYRIIYNCAMAQTLLGAKTQGQTFNKDCEFLTGCFCSNGTHPSPMKLVLHGQYKNPTVTVNDIKIDIEGDYDGEIAFMPNGDIYYTRYDSCTDGCNDYKGSFKIPYDKIKYPDHKITFVAYYGDNHFYVTNDIKNPSISFVTILVDELTV